MFGDTLVYAQPGGPLMLDNVRGTPPRPLQGLD